MSEKQEQTGVKAVERCERAGEERLVYLARSWDGVDCVATTATTRPMTLSNQTSLEFLSLAGAEIISATNHVASVGVGLGI